MFPIFPIRVDINPKIRIKAVAELLNRAVANVIRNAAKYAGTNETVCLCAKKNQDQIILEIRKYMVLLTSLVIPWYHQLAEVNQTPNILYLPRGILWHTS